MIRVAVVLFVLVMAVLAWSLCVAAARADSWTPPGPLPPDRQPEDREWREAA